MSIDGSLPAELYTQPEAFQRERRQIFGDAWLMLARAGILTKPGDYVAQSLGGWPVFAIADPTGAPRAFRNACRHQKLPLFDSGAGHCEQIRCHYHGWTYDIAGRFLTAPPPVAPSGEVSSDLERVAVETLHGLLFVHLDDDPPPLADMLPSLDTAMTKARLDACGFCVETKTNAGVRAVDIRNPFRPREIGYFIPAITKNTDKRCVKIDGQDRCKVAIQTNNVEVDDRGYIYIVDRANTGMHILELTGEARKIADLHGTK